MNLKFKIIFFTIIAILCVRGLVTYDFLNKYEVNFDKTISQYSKNIKRLLKLEEDKLTKLYSRRLQSSLKFHFNKEDIINRNTDKLATPMSKVFKVLQAENSQVNTFHLIDKNNITLFRAHKPDKYGDDLTDIRPIIVNTNKTKKVHSGYEVGVHSISFRVNVPIIFDNDHYGVLEVGLDMKEILKDLKTISENSMIRLVVDTKNLKDFDYLTKLKHSNGFVIISESKPLSLSNTNIFDKKVVINDKIFYSIDYGLQFNNGDNIAKILYYYDITENVEDYDSLVINMNIQTILILLFVTMLLYISFTYYENQILELIKKSKEKDKVIMQQSKLAIMGEMISMLAHQWRQPITAISTSAQGIQFKKDLGVLTDKYLKEQLLSIANITKSLSDMITSFTTFFQSDEDKQNISISSVIDNSLGIIKASLKLNNIETKISIEEDVNMYIYVSELKQVLVNIIKNAKDAIIERNIENGWIHIEFKVDKHHYIINIEDNAGGIEKEYINQVFDPYFSTKSKNGTGLGLYMSKMIIDEHFNGLLVVKNSENGAKFSIKIKK
jgi:signal transduction histidine kinase